MPFKILRNDITKMNTDAIVNTASSEPIVGSGCDFAVYQAAGYDELLKYREEKIGEVPEGEVFITPGFNLPAKYIIHAVSPLYLDGDMGEEEKLRSCYRKSLLLAEEKGLKSIAFPLISTGNFGYPKEEGMRIALDEIREFLGIKDEETAYFFSNKKSDEQKSDDEIMVYLVVFDEKATQIGTRLFPDLDAYIDRHYVEKKVEEEYLGDLWAPDGKTDRRHEKKPDTSSLFPQSSGMAGSMPPQNFACSAPMNMPSPGLGSPEEKDSSRKKPGHFFGSIFRRETEENKGKPREKRGRNKKPVAYDSGMPDAVYGARQDFTDEEPATENLYEEALKEEALEEEALEEEALEEEALEEEALKKEETTAFFDFEEEHESRLEERMQHLADTFSEYLLYLIKEKHMENAEVYKRAIVDKKVFSKIKNNPAYHPQKLTALCLCVGAKLNLDETRDLLARAGYALSPCDKTDVIFSYFIENKIYDMIELDIQLEEHGLPCIIA